MSTGPESNESVPTAECRVCQTDVPAGEYCGLCGCHLTPRRGEGPDWLRIRDFGAAPGEHLLQPSLTSSLFPHLPSRSRTAFRLGLVVVLVALVAFTLLRLPAALVTVSALGLPLLFLIYLRESDAFHDVPLGTWVLTAALGIGLAVGWVLLTGAAVARSYGIALGSGIVGARMLRDGIGIPLGGVVLMLMPAVIVRLLRPPTREALEGFMIGALGALSFTAAATLTRLAPQFGSGVVSKRPMESLVVEAGIRGVAVPLTAAAAGGLIGAALWFTRPPSKEHQRPGLVRLVLVLFAAAVLVVYLALGLIDVSHFPQMLMLVSYLGVALVALLLLRVGLHLALLHEAHDEIQTDEPLLCPHCGHVVPDMAFCPACGAATRASSRTSRKTRREIRPVRTEAEPEGP
ncbi:MAG TPA: zinc ribbon domain-containing protein [Mycobacterium sp.]|nr:zinc ribbon domain-containing protein [Mycobacterium sp.]